MVTIQNTFYTWWYFYILYNFKSKSGQFYSYCPNSQIKSCDLYSMCPPPLISFKFYTFQLGWLVMTHPLTAPASLETGVRGKGQCDLRRRSSDRGWRSEAWERNSSRRRGSSPHSMNTGSAKQDRLPLTCTCTCTCVNAHTVHTVSLPRMIRNASHSTTTLSTYIGVCITKSDSLKLSYFDDPGRWVSCVWFSAGSVHRFIILPTSAWKR